MRRLLPSHTIRCLVAVIPIHTSSTYTPSRSNWWLPIRESLLNVFASSTRIFKVARLSSALLGGKRRLSEEGVEGGGSRRDSCHLSSQGDSLGDSQGEEGGGGVSRQPERKPDPTRRL